MTYLRQYFQFPSQILRRDLEVLHFGDAGYPLILIPAGNRRFFDVEDQGLINSLRWHLDQGYVQVFCVESFDWETFFASTLLLPERRNRWLTLEQHWTDEFIPYVRKITQNDFVVVGGCSLGGTHALNLSLRHPRLVRRCLALAGPVDLVNTPGIFDEFSQQEKERELYFINPVAYMSNMSCDRWQALGGDNIDIKFLSATEDGCLTDHIRLSEILHRNNIPPSI